MWLTETASLLRVLKSINSRCFSMFFKVVVCHVSVVLTVTVDRDVSVVCVEKVTIIILRAPKYLHSRPESIHIIGLEEGDFAVLSDGGTFGSSTLNYLLLY